MRRALAVGGLAAALSCKTGPVLTPPPPAPETTAARITFQPGAASYRTASHLHVEQQVGDQTQENDVALIYFLTVRLTSDTGGLNAVLVIDSVPRYDMGDPGGADAERARGATFTGRLAPDGAMPLLLARDSGGRLVEELGPELQRFFPTGPAGGFEPGQHWTDSSETQTTSSGVPLTMRAAHQHSVGSATLHDGVEALPVHTTTIYTFSGTGSQGGQEFTVEGEGRRETVEWLSLNGRYLGRTAADTSTFTITMRAVDATIPGHQTRADTVSLIR